MKNNFSKGPIDPHEHFNRYIIINPGPDYKILSQDLCFYISLVKEENYDWKLAKSKLCRIIFSIWNILFWLLVFFLNFSPNWRNVSKFDEQRAWAELKKRDSQRRNNRNWIRWNEHECKPSTLLNYFFNLYFLL
jgi:hypothetical protein